MLFDRRRKFIVRERLPGIFALTWFLKCLEKQRCVYVYVCIGENRGHSMIYKNISTLVEIFCERVYKYITRIYVYF